MARTNDFLWIKAEPMPGVDVWDAIQKGKALAARLQCGVEMQFNDHRMLLTADSSIKGEADRYFARVERPEGGAA